MSQGDPMEWFKLNEMSANRKAIDAAKRKNSIEQAKTQDEIRKLRQELEASQTKPVICPACDNKWSQKYDYLEEACSCYYCGAIFKWSFEYGRAEITEKKLQHHKEVACKKREKENKEAELKRHVAAQAESRQRAEEAAWNAWKHQCVSVASAYEQKEFRMFLHATYRDRFISEVVRSGIPPLTNNTCYRLFRKHRRAQFWDEYGGLIVIAVFFGLVFIFCAGLLSYS